MRYLIIVLSMLLWSAVPAVAQVSIGIGLPGVSIGINLPLFPELVRVPGYPVYYAPRLDSNFFFYDGMYWVYERDNWYASTWYNGPWALVSPESVPLYVLRIPVRYYRDPPMYFRGWRADAPPRWGQHWGNAWEQQRSGWDRWNRRSAPAPAPLPVYQRQYSGDRYPQAEQQQAVRNENYRYRPREAVVRQHDQAQAEQRAPTPAMRGQQEAPQQRTPRPQEGQRSIPPAPVPQAAAPIVHAAPPAQKAIEETHRVAPPQAPPRQREPSVQAPAPQRAPERQEQQPPRQNQEAVQQGRGAPQESGRGQGQRPGQGQGQGQGQEHDRGEERGQERGQDRGR